MKKELKHLLKSRTVRTIFIMFLFNLVDLVGMKIPTEVLLPINALLTALAAYYRVTPKTVK